MATRGKLREHLRRKCHTLQHVRHASEADKDGAWIRSEALRVCEDPAGSCDSAPRSKRKLRMEAARCLTFCREGHIPCDGPAQGVSTKAGHHQEESLQSAVALTAAPLHLCQSATAHQPQRQGRSLSKQESKGLVSRCHATALMPICPRPSGGTGGAGTAKKSRGRDRSGRSARCRAAAERSTLSW